MFLFSITYSITYSDRQELIVFMNSRYENLNTSFVTFWSSHKQCSTCKLNCFRTFVTDGFQKASRYICSNSNMFVYNEELGMQNMLTPSIVLWVYQKYGSIAAIGQNTKKSQNLMKLKMNQ